MKQLLALIVLVLVLGLLGLVYRNALEHPLYNTNHTSVSCTEEAKMCPDGTSVARSGPTCAFAACVLPNIELPEAGISFVLPVGFVVSEGAIADPSRIALFAQTALAERGSATIAIHSYRIPEGKTANDAVLATVQSIGGSAVTMQDFTPVIIQGNTYETIRTSKPGSAGTAYYLLRENSVLLFQLQQQPQAPSTGTATTTSSSSSTPASVPTRASDSALQQLLGTVRMGM